MRHVQFLLACAVLSGPLVAQPTRAASVSDFLEYNLLSESGGLLFRGRLHEPAEYASDPSELRPLILFFHGAGESGTNNLAHINGNIDNLLAAAKTRDAFLYAPQTNVGWGNATLMSYAMTMIDRAIAERNVDPNRIYVTGLSMGGGGAWNFLNQFPDRVAATVPICAVSPTSSFDPASLIDEPIWAYHGRFDTTVSALVTRGVVDSLLSAAGLPLPTYPPFNTFDPNLRLDFPPLDLHYSDYRGQHDIWPRVYRETELYEWMFAHGAVPEPTTVGLLLIGVVACGSSRTRRQCHATVADLSGSET